MDSLLTLIVFVFSVSAISTDCVPKHFDGQDSFVCVCNENSCDYLPKLRRLSEDQVISFESDKHKNRFKRRVLKPFSESSAPEVDLTIAVDKHAKKQEIIGFGGAFTDATGINLKKLSPKLQDRIIRDYFSENGLSYSMGRVVIGGSDFSDRNYTLDDHEDDVKLEKFALTHDDHLYKAN